jgi:hypothetical protein
MMTAAIKPIDGVMPQSRTTAERFFDDVRLAQTAVHEAGHATFALCHGLRVTEASVVPDPQEQSLGHVERDPLPTPTEELCRPGSPYIDFAVKLLLAGDRAGRVLWPDRETCGGGRGSDYARANRLLEAVYAAAEVEGVLDELCRNLDDFFAAWPVAAIVGRIATALLHEQVLPEARLRDLFTDSDKQCGAFDEAFERRCEREPNHDIRLGHHRVVWCENEPWPGRRFEEWGPTVPEFWYRRLPLSKHSAMWKRVMRELEPHRVPPRKNEATIESAGELIARWKNPTLTPRQQAAASRRLIALVRARQREGIAQNLSNAASTATVLEQHAARCTHRLDKLNTSELWCGWCGLLHPDRSVDNSLFVAVTVDLDAYDSKGVRPRLFSEPVVALRNRQEAADYLRIMREGREQSDGVPFVWRVPIS